VHGTETLHGDVKAHNVMRSQGGEIVLMDFGTSKDLSRDQRRQDSDFAGTPLYLAPEVFAGAPRTKASDIYSLGVLLYYLVSGKYPVEGSTRTELGRQHAEPGARRPLRDARPDLPDAFVRVVEQALADTPSNRFASAGAFETALAAVVSRPAPAPPHTPALASRLAPWRKLAVLATAGVILVGGAVLLPRLRSNVQQAAPSDASALSSPAVANAVPVAPGSYTVDAAVFREEKGAQVRLPPGARVSPGDALFLELRASVPAYVYIITEDEAGESYLLFPLPGQSLTNPLAAGVRHRLPGTIDNTRYSWLVSSLGGREHFLIFVSPERSTAFETLFASLPKPVEGKPIAVKLPAAAVGQLRGIGGLVATPTQVDQGIRKAPEFATPLPDGAETTRGLWIRQIAFENPARK
jgi:serine/threonine protein kinase